MLLARALPFGTLSKPPPPLPETTIYGTKEVVPLDTGRPSTQSFAVVGGGIFAGGILSEGIANK